MKIGIRAHDFGCLPPVRLAEKMAAQGVEAAQLAIPKAIAGVESYAQVTDGLLREIGAATPISVIEGDQETHLDADRLRGAGGRVVQINTGSGGHLDADMVEEGLRSLQPAGRSMVFIENIGNLAAPALFDLGEHHRVLIASITEGEDKPLKYPHVFRTADLVLLNKVDLLPHLEFDVDRFVAHARRVNPRLQVLALSAKSGDGVAEWCGWLRAHHDGTHGNGAHRGGAVPAQRA